MRRGHAACYHLSNAPPLDLGHTITLTDELYDLHLNGLHFLVVTLGSEVASSQAIVVSVQSSLGSKRAQPLQICWTLG